jgi:hypothetical protein
MTEEEREHLLAIAARTPTPTAMWKPKPLVLQQPSNLLHPNTNVLASQAQFVPSPLRLNPPSLLPPISPKNIAAKKEPTTSSTNK